MSDKLDEAVRRIADIGARLDAVAVRRDEFDESEHPRASDGKFGSGGGGGGKSKKNEAPISKIKTSQAKSETKSGGVKMYREKLRNGEKLKPITVVKARDTGEFHVLDGHHRLEAYRAEGRTDVPIEVHGEVANGKKAREFYRAMRFG